MAVILYLRVPELSPERYHRLMVELELDVNPPAGMVLHVASEHVGAVDIVEIWRTPESAERFVETRLKSVAVGLGVRDPLAYRIEPMRNVFVPDFEMLERIGATSLPAGSAGRIAS